MSGTNYTTSLRLGEPVPGNPAVRNVWGGILNADMTLIEAAITGLSSVALTGLTQSLTTANGAADQARNQIIKFTGTPGGTCTVTVPSVPKLGLFANATSDSSSVVLTTGAGTTITLPADGFWYWTYCDGTNVIGVPIATRDRVVAPEFEIDDNFYIVISAGDPIIAFDATDFLTYDRALNKLAMLIGGAAQFAVEVDRVSSLVQFNISAVPPATSTSPGSAGDITWDVNYFYVCTGPNNWARTPLSSF